MMTDPSTVRIRNLRTGRLRRVPIPATSGAALDLELKANGSFADLRNVGDAPAGSLAPNGYVFAIRRVDSRGSFVVARGSDIDPDSLVLRGSYIRWKQRGSFSGQRCADGEHEHAAHTGRRSADDRHSAVRSDESGSPSGRRRRCRSRSPKGDQR